MAVSFLTLPLRGLAFSDAEPTNCHPSGFPLGVKFPSTRFTGGTFPRRHWLDPVCLFNRQVREVGAEVPPQRRLLNTPRERSPIASCLALAESGQVRACREPASTSPQLKLGG